MRSLHTHVCSYLILCKGSKVLLMRRQNTGFCDGQYGLLSGHIEEGESATEGLVREAQEEAGIVVDPKDLHFVHCRHSRSHRTNIDLFFTCDVWQGEVSNCEPEKCDALDFFERDALPATTIPYIAATLKYVNLGLRYSEYGWSTDVDD